MCTPFPPVKFWMKNPFLKKKQTDQSLCTILENTPSRSSSREALIPCRILYSLLLDSMRTMFLRVDNTEETIEGKSLICIYYTGLFIEVNVTDTT